MLKKSNNHKKIEIADKSANSVKKRKTKDDKPGHKFRRLINDTNLDDSYNLTLEKDYYSSDSHDEDDLNAVSVGEEILNDDDSHDDEWERLSDFSDDDTSSDSSDSDWSLS